MTYRVCDHRQENPKARASELACDQKDIAARKQRALARDRKTQPHASFLERDGGLEERFAGQIAQTGT